MATLAGDLRKLLDKTIIAARRHAESGAHRALESLAVERHEPHPSMSPDERRLRNRLRARGRQLGDRRDQRGDQEIARLTHEVAYEQWHRMLFARFLAENGVLVEPRSGVSITVEECEELARERGVDPHALAAQFAQEALPGVFRVGDPALDVTFAPETRQVLQRLLDGLPSVVFTADDSLGWTYQFWQTKSKDEINASEVKIGADELPAVTQLFTEPYMVQFLFHNTIGAWHAGNVLRDRPGLADTARSEDELRQAVRLDAQDGYDFEFLRFVRDPQDDDEEGSPTGKWRPAAGTHDGWPKSAREIKILDPCCGSGHFLTEGLQLLVRLRMHEERLALDESISSVLTDNLYGLELDPRCAQIAAFNVALTAWKLAGRPMDLPALHIACSGISPASDEEEWTAIAGDQPDLIGGMRRLHGLFGNAAELGSLIDPRSLAGHLFAADFSKISDLLTQALDRERLDDERTERAVAAQGMTRAAELLMDSYTLAITNVPYLGRSMQAAALTDFADDQYPDAKHDLATVFIERLLRCLGEGGTQAVVAPQNWLFLKRYRKLRETLLRRRTWNVTARLGPGAFETISGQVVNVALLVISEPRPAEDSTMVGIDAAIAPKPPGKASLLRGESTADLNEEQAAGHVWVRCQNEQLGNPQSVVLFQHQAAGDPLKNTCTALSGCSAGDRLWFVRKFWEVAGISDAWEFHQTATSFTSPYRGREEIILWESEQGAMFGLAESVKSINHSAQNWRKGKPNWGKRGVVVSLMGSLSVALYGGDIYASKCTVLVPHDWDSDNTLLALWMYCSSPSFAREVRKLNQKLAVEVKTLLEVPFDQDYWQQVAVQECPDGLPAPQSDDPAQWLFHGHPAKAEPSTVLQVAVGRLLGYTWPAEIGAEMILADSARHWVARCGALTEYADESGIACLSAMRGVPSAANRLRRLLAAAFG